MVEPSKHKVMKRWISSALTFAKRNTRPIRLSIPNLVVRRFPPSGQPIAILGNGRSGTSWIGETIGRAHETVYYREPCHPQSVYANDDTVWSRYVPPDGSDPQFEYCLDQAFRGAFIGDVDFSIGEFRRRMSGPYRVVVKEVAAFFSAEWLCERYHPRVLFVTRHPCPSVMSVHNLNLVELEKRRYREIIGNALLRASSLKPHLAHLETLEDPLEISAGIWAIKNLVAVEAWRKRDEWIHLTYEAACMNPKQVFRELYNQLNLEWTLDIEESIEHSTSTATAGFHTTAKVSQKQIDGWRDKMTREEKEKVRAVVEPFNLPFYREDDDWT